MIFLNTHIKSDRHVRINTIIIIITNEFMFLVKIISLNAGIFNIRYAMNVLFCLLFFIN